LSFKTSFSCLRGIWKNFSICSLKDAEATTDFCDCYIEIDFTPNEAGKYFLKISIILKKRIRGRTPRDGENNEKSPKERPKARRKA
jgi:hypothetical protein